MEIIIYLSIILRNAYIFLTILWLLASSTGKIFDGWIRDLGSIPAYTKNWLVSWSDNKKLPLGADTIWWNYYITSYKLLNNIVVLYTNLYLEYYFKLLFIFYFLQLQFPSSSTDTPRKNSGPAHWDQVKNSLLFMFWILVFKKKKRVWRR